MRLAAHFRIWDVDGWLQQMSWDQLKDWIDFVQEEPIGEERDDLRIGALATRIHNVNMAKVEDMLRPSGYVMGMVNENGAKTHVFALNPKEGNKSNQSPNDSRDNTLNNPIMWANFKANMIQYAGGIKKGKEG